MTKEISNLVSFFRDWLFEEKKINSTSLELSDHSFKILLEDESYFTIIQKESGLYTIEFLSKIAPINPECTHVKIAVKLQELMKNNFANISSDDELALKTFFEKQFGILLDDSFDQEN